MPTSINNNNSLFIYSSLPVNNNDILYTINYRENNNIALFIESLGDKIDNAINLYLKNPGADSGIELSIWGIGYSSNPDSANNNNINYDSIYLFINAQGSIGYNSTYINAGTDNENNANLYVNSMIPINSGLPMSISQTIGNINNYIRNKMYTHGF